MGTKAAEGISAGAGEIKAAFGGDIIPEVSEINKVNGLVDEYMRIYAQCRERWPYGLGRYLLEKLAESMTKDGVLTVGKKEGARGHHYQDALAKLSAKLPTKKVVEPLAVPPPE